MSSLFWRFYDWCIDKSDAIKKSFFDYFEELEQRFSKPSIVSIMPSSISLIQDTNSSDEIKGYRYLKIETVGFGRFYINKTMIRTRGKDTFYFKVSVNKPIIICIKNIFGTEYASLKDIHPYLRYSVRQEGSEMIFSEDSIFLNEPVPLPKLISDEALNAYIPEDPISLFKELDKKLANIPNQVLQRISECEQEHRQKIKSLHISYNSVHQNFTNRIKEDKL